MNRDYVCDDVDRHREKMSRQIGKVRCEPGEKHRWRMSRESCVKWQAESWSEPRMSHRTDHSHDTGNLHL